MKGLCSKLLRKKQTKRKQWSIHCNCGTLPQHFAPVLISSLSYFLHNNFHLFRHLALVPCEIPPQQHFMCNFLRKHWDVYMRSEFSFWFSLHVTLQSFRVPHASKFPSLSVRLQIIILRCNFLSVQSFQS